MRTVMQTLDFSKSLPGDYALRKNYDISGTLSRHV